MFRSIAMLILCLATVTADAVPIAYVFSGTGSGDVNGTSFTGRAFTFTFYGDTNNVLTVDPTLRINAVETESATLQISGFGLASITRDTYVFARLDIQTIGITRQNPSSDIFDVRAPALATYDLTDSLGPILTTVPFPLVGSQGSFATSVGGVTFTAYMSDSTFSAQIVPLPPAVWLFGSALGVMGWMRRQISS